jgi:hypothetical protein
MIGDLDPDYVSCDTFGLMSVLDFDLSHYVFPPTTFYSIDHGVVKLILNSAVP